MYSWIRFTCTSNMDEGLIFTLYSFSRNWENFSLFSCGDKGATREPVCTGTHQPVGGGGARAPPGSCRPRNPRQEASPASRWRFLGGRRHHPGSLAASSAGSSLSRSLPRFSFSLEKRGSESGTAPAHTSSLCPSVAGAYNRAADLPHLVWEEPFASLRNAVSAAASVRNRSPT